VKILLDENLDWRLSRHLPGHEVKAVTKIGWAGVKIGELLRRAALEFDVLITLDGSMQHQQDSSKHDLAVISLPARQHTSYFPNPCRLPRPSGCFHG
jgi:hypothetical protein